LHGVHNEGLIDLFARTTDDIVSLEEFRALLDSRRQLRIKFGADVTAPFLHLGHAVNLWMMREMQERGHQVQFLIGDFTTRIGDPTGRSTGRPERSQADIEHDAAAFLEQIAAVLITDNPALFTVRRNAEWWGAATAADLVQRLGAVTVSRLQSRDMFRSRQESGSEVRMHELIYPVLQGWDSVELASDLTIVGSDQLFNESMGRFFQERQGQQAQVIITTKITPGLDGVKKQSKSLNNFVALADSPRDKFGKIMSLADALVVQWLQVYTTLPLPEIEQIDQGLAAGSLHPMEAKRILAQAVVERYHGRPAAAAEDRWFRETFSERAFPADAPQLCLRPGRIKLLDLLVLLAPDQSRSELRRLLLSGAVLLGAEKLADPQQLLDFPEGSCHEVKLGRRRHFRLLVQEE